MEPRFVEKLEIVNYGCVRDVELTLTPIHALIGPNDSGKSTILDAVQWLTSTVGGDQPSARAANRLIRSQQRSDVVFTATSGQQMMRVAITQGGGRMDVTGETLRPILHGSQLLRLDPDALRQPSKLIPSSAAARLSDERGSGLPAVYDVLLARKLDGFLKIRERVTHLFPAVASLDLLNPTDGLKALGIKLTDGTEVGAEQMSEGLLYYLAFAALPYLQPTAFLLIEEPENGLHPARIAEVMTVLREVSATTQVLIATHSPIVVNELRGEEITVLTRRPAEGTRAVRLVDTPGYAERSRVYLNGELWISYSDGEREAALLEGGPRP